MIIESIIIFVLMAVDMPFITAPLPYENMTRIYDHEAPSSPGDWSFFSSE